MFGNRRMQNGKSEEAQSRGHAVWEGAPCKGALYPICCSGCRKRTSGGIIPLQRSLSDPGIPRIRLKALKLRRAFSWIYTRISFGDG